MEDTRRRPPSCAGHVPRPSWRCWPLLEPRPSARPTLKFIFVSLSPSSRSTEPQPLAIADRASAVTSLTRHYKNAAASQLQAPPRPPLARRRLHAVSQPLVRPLSAFPRRRNLVGGEPAMANHHRGSLPPFSPVPRCLCELLMLTPVLDWTAMARVGRRNLHSATASTIADGDLLLCS